MPTTDTLNLVYWALLALGFVLMVGMLLLDGIFHFGDDGSIIPLICSFLVVFGGAGIVSHSLFGMGVTGSLVVASLSGTVGAGGFYFGIWKTIRNRESTLSDRREDIIGKTVEVSLTITPEQLGQITYTTPSGRNSAPARSEDGSAIRQGTPVEVIHSVGTTYIVRPISIPRRSP